MHEHSDPADFRAGEAVKVVAFELGGHHFCIDIMSIREIRPWTQTTPLPHAPESVRGIINLRGAVLPVVDLSSRLGFGFSEPGPRHGVIVTEMPDAQVTGFLVDRVTDILEIRPDDLHPTPDMVGRETKDFVRGVIARPSGMMAFLIIDKLAPTDRYAEAA